MRLWAENPGFHSWGPPRCFELTTDTTVLIPEEKLLGMVVKALPESQLTGTRYRPWGLPHTLPSCLPFWAVLLLCQLLCPFLETNPYTKRYCLWASLPTFLTLQGAALLNMQVVCPSESPWQDKNSLSREVCHCKLRCQGTPCNLYLVSTRAPAYTYTWSFLSSSWKSRTENLPKLTQSVPNLQAYDDHVFFKTSDHQTAEPHLPDLRSLPWVKYGKHED